MARKSHATVTSADSSIKFEFEGGPTHDISLDTLPADIVNKLAVYGLSAKLRSSYAGVDKVKEAVKNFDAALARLMAGEWVATREAGAPKMNMLAEALYRAMKEAGTPKTEQECIDAIGKLSEEQRAGARQNVAIAKHLADIKSEREAAKAAKLREAAGEEGADLGSLF